MLKTKFSVLFLAIIIAVPHASFAYLDTKATAVQINEDTLLYTITYRFNFMNHSLRMPIGAVRGLQSADVSPYVSYALLDGSETPFMGGDAYSMILSNTEVVDNEYYLPEGVTGYFTLLTLVKLAPSTISSTVNDTKLSLRVTSLPFTLIKDGEETATQLSSSDLTRYYTTPVVEVK